MRTAPFFLLLLAGCVSIPLPHARGEDAPLLSRKLVAAKQEPQVLVAHDGTRCVTTEARFARAKPGDQVWCVWSDSSGRPETSESWRVIPGSRAAAGRPPR